MLRQSSDESVELGPGSNAPYVIVDVNAQFLPKVILYRLAMLL